MQQNAEASIFFGRRPVNPRLAWDPCFQEPAPDANSGQPAILYALDTWRGRHAVITANGWRLRSSGDEYRWNEIQLPLPDPIPTSDPESDLRWFRSLLRLDAKKHNVSWQTLVRWMLRSLQPDDKLDFRGYPILVLTGPPNAGKTIAAKLLTELLDPTTEPVHAIVKDLQGLIANHHVLLFDDIGKVSPKQAQELMRVGRPLVLTTRSKDDTRDLAKHALHVELPPVENPISQQEIRQQFAGLQATILGAVLTLLSRNFNAMTEERFS